MGTAVDLLPLTAIRIRDTIGIGILCLEMKPMPRDDGLPPGTLTMLTLRVLASQPLHGYAIAQRIAELSCDELSVEEGSLYPALQKLLLKGWVKATPVISATGRAVREYRLTASGRRQLDQERANYRRVTRAITTILDKA
jgi:transcriptional regulator